MRVVNDELQIRSQRLAELASQVRRLRETQRPNVGLCPTGFEPLDAALGGGLARGAIHELLTPDTFAPARTLALLLARRAMETAGSGVFAPRGQWLLYLDQPGDFYPPAAASLGVRMERLVVVRPRRSVEALWACEQALRCRSVAAVIAPLPGLSSYISRRLQLAAERGGGLGLILRSDHGADASFAATRLRCDAQPRPWDSPAVQVTVLKLRDGRSSGPLTIRLRPPADGRLTSPRGDAPPRWSNLAI